MTLMGTFECDICIDEAKGTGNGHMISRGTGYVARGFDTIASLNRHKSVMHGVREDQSKLMTVSLYPLEIAMLDAKRGKMNRSDFVRKLIKES
jgi:hypothetical protein